MRQNRDILWKGVLRWVVDDLLRFVYPNAEEIFDFERPIDFLDKELDKFEPDQGKGTGTRFADNLVKVFRKDGNEEWILLHCEVQDVTKAKDRLLFPERMFTYFYRCFDKHKTPIAAISIFCGPDSQALDNCFRYDFMDTQLAYKYRALRVLDYDFEELGRSDNPFAWVMLAAKYALLKGKKADSKLLEGKLLIFKKLYENGLFEKKKLQAVLKFIDNLIQFAQPETIRIFKEEIDEMTHKKNTMDIFEAVTEMKVEEKVNENTSKIIKNLLVGSKLSVDEIANFVEVSVGFVNKVKRNLDKKK